MTTRRIVIPAALTAILACALWVRVAPIESAVFREDGSVRLLGADAYYHLRHARYVVGHFPHVQRWDVGTNYPRGHRAKAAGLHGWVMGAAALVAGAGHPSAQTVAATVAWTPPILGVLALLAVFALGRRLVDSVTGLLACAVASLYPGGFLVRTALGYADHHAAEILWSLLAVWGVVDCLSQSGSRRWRRAVLQAAPMAVLLFTWLGAPLVVLVIGLGVVGVLVLSVAADRAGPEPGAAFFRYGTCLLLMVAMVGVIDAELIMIPAVFPHILVACALLAVGPATLLAAARALRRRGLRKGWVAAALAVSLVLPVWLALALVPGAGSLLAELVGPKTELVSEHTPVTLGLAWLVLGIPGLVALAAPAVTAVAAFRDGRDGPAFFASLVGGLLMALWWRTHDYGYAIPPWSGLLAAVALRLVLVRAMPGRAALRRLVTAAFCVATVAPIWPLTLHPPPWPLPEQVDQVVIVNDGWAQAMDWMAHETPEPSLPIDARVDPFEGDFHYPPGSYGVVTAWDDGSIVAALGRRVPVASQGVSATVARWMLLTDEDEAVHFWDDRLEAGERVRYVVLDAETLGDRFVATIEAAGLRPLDFADLDGRYPTYGPRAVQSLAVRLYVGAGDGLRRHRLVYQSPHCSALYYQSWSGASAGEAPRFRLRSEPIDSAEEAGRFEALIRQRVIPTPDGEVYGAHIVPTVRIFEQVSGARLIGTSTPGARVRARLALRSVADGTSLMYRQEVQADDRGRFGLSLPYSTDGLAPSDIQPLSLYAIEVDLGDGSGFTRVVQVGAPESAVQAGEVLDLGRLDQPPSR